MCDCLSQPGSPIRYQQGRSPDRHTSRSGRLSLRLRDAISRLDNAEQRTEGLSALFRGIPAIFCPSVLHVGHGRAVDTTYLFPSASH
ncbi:hypothetical protein Trydic_g21206 [Trypoxylus dichotomus]